MQIEDRLCVITGAASGIGPALARRFATEGARGIVVADTQTELVKSIASEVGGLAFVGDMTSETNLLTLVKCPSILQ